MVAHRGLCLVHRAEIITLGGAWRDALEEARRVAERFTEGVLNQRALGHAAYRQGEVHRLQGEFVRPRPSTGMRAGSAENRSRALPCCGWRSTTGKLLPRPFVER
jgi:hypothetical protein